MSQSVSVIVFDLGNVLLPFSYAEMYKNMNSTEPGLGEKFADLYKENYRLHRGLERGDIEEQTFLDEMMRFTEGKIDKETFCLWYSEIFTPDTKTASLLPVLQKKGYRLILLSNTSGIHQRYGWQKYDFLNIFEKKFLSHEVNALKPEEKIYKAVMQYTQLPGNAHLFIDDIPEYTQAAKNLGWEAHTHTRYETLLEFLITNKYIVENDMQY